jgi:hypothetical protein
MKKVTSFYRAFHISVLASVLISPSLQASSSRLPEYDLVVYGGTAAGVMAAVQASRSGHSVILLEPGDFIGGMTTGGLGATDTGRGTTVGGLAMEFYNRVYDYYLDPENWQYESRTEYLPKHHLSVSNNLEAHWFFEPKVASLILEEMIAENPFPIVFQARLNREEGVIVEGDRIVEIEMTDGRSYRGRYFIDTTYEGDLMAATGVSYFVGREANAEFGETRNGIITLPPHRAAHVDPYVIPGDPASGLLPRILPERPGPEGSADNRTQAYNFRMCLTDVPENRVSIEKPKNYNPLEYEVVLRHIQGMPEIMPGNQPSSGLFTLTPMPNRKTDSNNRNLFSTDYVGMSWGWPEGTYEEREEILEAHKTYTQGLFWFLGNDPRVPEHIREEVLRWGLPKDEFVDNGHWPHQLYVREARRMRSDYIVTEHDAMGATEVGDPITLASYALDSHLVSLYLGPNDRLMLEGAFFRHVSPFPISYRAIIPTRGECTNLFVPVCLSSTHAAFGSIRMEPVFMMLAQAAAVAVGIAIEDDMDVQDVPFDSLRSKLMALDKVIEIPGGRGVSREAEAVSAKPLSPQESIDRLVKAGHIPNADYWIENARPGMSVSGALVGDLIVRVVSEAIEPVATFSEGVQVLLREKIITNGEYWTASAVPGEVCTGGRVAALLSRLALIVD